jgi:hypothetical protein
VPSTLDRPIAAPAQAVPAACGTDHLAQGRRGLAGDSLLGQTYLGAVIECPHTPGPGQEVIATLDSTGEEVVTRVQHVALQRGQTVLYCERPRPLPDSLIGG